MVVVKMCTPNWVRKWMMELVKSSEGGHFCEWVNEGEGKSRVFFWEVFA